SSWNFNIVKRWLSEQLEEEICSSGICSSSRQDQLIHTCREENAVANFLANKGVSERENKENISSNELPFQARLLMLQDQ
ncbi:unnamed protein product, partial [Ilex paraguariensis]